jgi:hypothetical protein
MPTETTPTEAPAWVVAAADCVPATASYSLVPFLLTARDGIWLDRLRQETNSAQAPR